MYLWILSDFNTLLSIINRTSREKISKETKALNKQPDPTDIYRTCVQPDQTKHSFLSAPGTFTKTDHIPSIKQASIHLKGIKWYQILSYHNGTKSDINNKVT